MRLELGSGYHPTPGFVHFDANCFAPDVDIVGDAACPAQYGVPVGEVTELRAVDVLEHLSYRYTQQVLARWAALLAPGGRLYVQVPDADKIMRWYTTAPSRLVERIPDDLRASPLMGAAWRLLGGHADTDNGRDDFRLNAHYSLWSRGSLDSALTRAGLVVESMEVNDHPNVCAWAVKP